MYDIRESLTAHTVDEALSLLSTHEGMIPAAGGTDILIKVRDRKLKAVSLVSILGIPELNTISMEKDGSICIGSVCCFNRITEDPLIMGNIPMLGEACRQIGSPQIRNVATIGGNICNGAVSADSVTPLYALDAVLTLRSMKGERCIPKESFAKHGSCYIKFGQRKAMEIATLGCAVNVSLSEDKTKICSAAIAYGVAAPTPVRCTETEALLTGMTIGPELFKTAREHVTAELQPRDSWRASKELRIQLIKELVVRALKGAVIRAGGEVD